MRQQQRLISFGAQSTKCGEFESIFVDEDSVPFGHYQLTRLQEIVYKLFQFRVLPRGFLFKAVHRSIVRRRGCLTNDVSIHGIRLRMQAEGNACEKKFLGKGKYFDHKDIQALASACQIVDQPVFIDIGANVGLYSFLLNKAVPGLRALALEPHPGIYKKLRYNIGLNPDLQIESLQYAVSDQSGLVKLKTDYSNLGMTKISTEGEIDVECTTLMDLINTERVSHVDAIKVDVEGFEDRVLVPYLKEATEDRLARVIVLEFVNQHRWKENLFEYTRLRGFREVQRTRMNSILAR